MHPSSLDSRCQLSSSHWNIDPKSLRVLPVCSELYLQSIELYLALSRCSANISGISECDWKWVIDLLYYLSQECLHFYGAFWKD